MTRTGCIRSAIAVGNIAAVAVAVLIMVPVGGDGGCRIPATAGRVAALLLQPCLRIRSTQVADQGLHLQRRGEGSSKLG